MKVFWKSNYAMLTNPFYLQAHEHLQRIPGDFCSQFDLTKAMLTHPIYSHT